MTVLKPTKADTKIDECLKSKQSFALIAGAGSGKTTSLITALEKIREMYGADLQKNSQRVTCITYTNRAVDVIQSRLDHNDLFLVSTLHSFLWDEIKTFSKDIRNSLAEYLIPKYIVKAKNDDNGRQSKKALRARKRAADLEVELTKLDSVSSFTYNDSAFSEYSKGFLGHDDVIAVAGHLLHSKEVFRKALGFRYPFIFIDEAQDTFPEIVEGLNLLGAGEGLPVVGYFGDPWQQIYEKRAGDFEPPPDGVRITKAENFRCSVSVIQLLNAFRDDVQQEPAGNNQNVQGSVLLTLVESEHPEEPRKRYSERQIDRALKQFEIALVNWNWNNRTDIIQLFLVRQMIARRLGFSDLQKLFTGDYASSRAQDSYESGEHFLLKPFLTTICPLVKANYEANNREILELLIKHSPAFDIHGRNSGRSLREMVQMAKSLLSKLADLWEKGTVREVLKYCHEEESGLVKLSERLKEHLKREPRAEEYNSEIHNEDKGDWLCDKFFEMKTAEIMPYNDYIHNNTPYSTQHGVKGEEYPNVLVVFDDIEAAWNNYSFSKLLTPNTSGDSTDGQLNRSQKLAYVCFSRAEVNLRILLFTPDPESAKQELVSRGIFSEDQITILRRMACD